MAAACRDHDWGKTLYVRAHMRVCLCLSSSSQLRMPLPWVKGQMKRDSRGGGGSLEKYGSHCGFGPSLLFV